MKYVMFFATYQLLIDNNLLNLISNDVIIFPLMNRTMPSMPTMPTSSNCAAGIIEQSLAKELSYERKAVWRRT